MRASAVKFVFVLAVLLFLMTASVSLQDDAVKVTAEVTSADHELPEGYFGLGPDIYLMVKPGTDAYSFLSRHRKDTIVVTFAVPERRVQERITR